MRSFMAIAFFAAAVLPALVAAPEGYFPLWQKKPPNAADTVLIYQGAANRLPWTPEQFAPYVSYRDPRDGREKWLVDGFLFIEYYDQGHAFSQGWTWRCVGGLRLYVQGRHGFGDGI